MVELILFLGALILIGNRARQRGLKAYIYTGVTIVVFGLLVVLGFMGLGVTALVLRWLLILGIYILVMRSRGGARVEENWKCPECQMVNDSATLVCLCGYRHPDAAAALGPQSDP